MPLQNRVTPEGEIVAVAARGLMMGNRGGALHDEHKRLGRRRWVTKQWICCRLAFKGRHRQVMSPRRYTELFFLDEATAMAAGHRPCFECRREDALAFAELWAGVKGIRGRRATAQEMDDTLHRERVDGRGAKSLHAAASGSLPVGAMVILEGSAHLITEMGLHRWTPDGYDNPVPRTASVVQVLTPPSMVAVIAAGFRPLLHPSSLSSERKL